MFGIQEFSECIHKCLVSFSFCIFSVGASAEIHWFTKKRRLGICLGFWIAADAYTNVQ